MFIQKASTTRPSTSASASVDKNNDDDPRTPVVVAQIREFKATEADSAGLNAILNRLETGPMDLQSQLEFLNDKSSIFCGRSTKMN
mmetsp:Transcript_15894/g.36796  ORF Transcript_15894/g.36796 Transcript_15894/m.36796 type:complete len:86 (-) Transcript_15894:402-659(-)